MNELTSLLIIIGVAVIIFLVTREFWCWYFKINHQNELLEEQNHLLKNIYIQLGGGSHENTELSMGKLNQMLRDRAITRKEYDDHLKQQKRKGGLF